MTSVFKGGAQRTSTTNDGFFDIWQRQQRLQVQRVTSVEQGVSTSAQEDLTRVIIFD